MQKPIKPKPYYTEEKNLTFKSIAEAIKIMERIISSSKEEMSPEDFECRNSNYYMRPIIVWQEKITDPAYEVNMIKYNAEMDAYKKELKQLLEDAEKEQ